MKLSLDSSNNILKHAILLENLKKYNIWYKFNRNCLTFSEKIYKYLIAKIVSPVFH